MSVFNNAWDREPKVHDVGVDALLRRMCLFEKREDISRQIYTNIALIKAGTASGKLAERISGRTIDDACESEARYQKSRLRAWSPATFDGTRKARNVRFVTCYVLDVEDGSPFSKAASIMVQYACAIHTSWSHTDDNPRLRLVFPLEEPVPAEHWKKCWKYMYVRVKNAGIQPDPKCVNPDRLYFLPAIPKRDSARRSVSRNGELLRLDWRTIPDLDQVQRRLVIRRAALNVKDYRDPAVRAALAARLDATVDDERAYHIRCPSCGRDDVYFFLRPTRRTWAKCNHERGCGWFGPLAELEG